MTNSRVAKNLSTTSYHLFFIYTFVFANAAGGTGSVRGGYMNRY